MTVELKHTKLNVYIPKEMYESLKEYVELDRCIFIEDNFMINAKYIQTIEIIG